MVPRPLVGVTTINLSSLRPLTNTLVAEVRVALRSTTAAIVPSWLAKEKEPPTPALADPVAAPVMDMLPATFIFSDRLTASMVSARVVITVRASSSTACVFWPDPETTARLLSSYFCWRSSVAVKPPSVVAVASKLALCPTKVKALLVISWMLTEPPAATKVPAAVALAKLVNS